MCEGQSAIEDTLKNINFAVLNAVELTGINDKKEVILLEGQNVLVGEIKEDVVLPEGQDVLVGEIKEDVVLPEGQDVLVGPEVKSS